MKKASFLHPLLLLVTLALASGGALLGMDKTPTGKTPYSVGWRSIRGNGTTPIQRGKESSYQASFVIALETDNNSKNIKQSLQSDDIPLDKPWIRNAPNRAQEFYYYPIEWVITKENPVSSFVALLEYQPDLVNGFQDYSPLKDILLKLMDRHPYDDGTDRLKGYLTKLIDDKVDLDKQLPDHIGLGPDNSPCKGCSARKFLERSKPFWKNQSIWGYVDDKFAKVPIKSIEPKTAAPVASTTPQAPALPASSAATTSPTVTMQPTAPTIISTVTTTPAPASPVATAPISSTTPIISAPQPATTSTPPASTNPSIGTGSTTPTVQPPVTPQAQTSGTPLATPPAPSSTPKASLWNWCQTTQSAIAKKTICALVIGATTAAVAAKLAYKHWWKQKPISTQPLTITIINDTDETFHVETDDTSTQQILPSKIPQTFDAQKITKLTIVTPQEESNDLSINLWWYKKYRKTNELCITIEKETSAFKRWLYDNEYTYKVTWKQSDPR